MVKCKNCGKGRPRLFNKDGGFCNQACYDEFKAKVVRRYCGFCRKVVNPIKWTTQPIMTCPDCGKVIEPKGLNKVEKIPA
ncbi:hypothetical protein ES703_31929 [subsurface metagenome]